MADLIASLLALPPRQLAGLCLAALFVLLALYLLFSERTLRRHLADVQPDRRLAYILHRWQLRDYVILFGFIVLCGIMLSLLPDTSPTTPKTVASPADQCASGSLPPDADAQEKQPPSDPSAMMDLFATSTDLMPQQTALNALKSRYENALTGSYILYHCQRTSQTELDLILKALRDDIIAYQASPDHPALDAQALYASIVSAAQGSYEMLYSHTSCDSPQTQMLEEQFANFTLHFKAKEQTPSAAAPTTADPVSSAPALPSRKKALPRSDRPRQ